MVPALAQNSFPAEKQSSCMENLYAEMFGENSASSKHRDKPGI